MAVTGSISFTSSFGQTATGVPSTSSAVLANSQFAKFNCPISGTAADAVDLKYSKTLTLAAAPTVLDLRNLTDVFGGTVTFARIKTLTIVNRATNNAYVLTVGYGTTTANAWVSWMSNPGTMIVPPSTASSAGFLALSAPNTTGWTAGSSNKLLNLDPGANTFDIDIEITGCSA